MERLAGKTIVVTGAASGLGRASATRFAASGARVVVADRDLAAAERVAADLPDGSIAVHVDVVDDRSVEDLVVGVVERFGRIDGFYANAGISGAGSLFDITRHEWDDVLSTNLTSVWLSVRAAARAMIETGGGSIVNQASVAGLTGIPKTAAYSAAKGGVVALTRQLAVDLAQHGIRVNAVCPGMVPTPLVMSSRSAMSDEDVTAQLEKAVGDYPLGRLGRPDDVAALAEYLFSDDSSWMTGAVLPIDGGLTAYGAR